MDKRRRRVSSLCTIVFVVGLHAALLWLLMTTARPFTKAMQSQTLELFVIPHSVPVAEKAPANNRVRTSPIPPAAIAAPPTEEKPEHPPVDWSGELSRSARDSVDAESAPKPRDFGFPHKPSAPGKTTEFAWDYAATHRVESIAEGGVLIHLNDNCVLVFVPLPFAICAPGKKPANGALFEHMHDPPPDAAH